MESLVGQRGQYQLHERVSVGGMAEVWLATGGSFRRPLAVKRLLPQFAAEPTLKDMFEDEARLTLALDLPDVCKALDAGDGFFVTEYVPGKDLRALLDFCVERGEPVPLNVACAVLARLAAAVDAVHRCELDGKPLRVVHRDLCPQSVLLGFDGRVVLSDFSVARSALRSSETEPGVVKGRFGYMAPERIRGQPFDHRSDVFALGVCLYEVFSGQRLFQADTDFATLEKAMQCVVPPLPASVPPELDALVRRALMRELKVRVQTAGELAAALKPFGEALSPATVGGFLRDAFPDDHAREQAWLHGVSVGAPSLDALIRGRS